MERNFLISLRTPWTALNRAVFSRVSSASSSRSQQRRRTAFATDSFFLKRKGIGLPQQGNRGKLMIRRFGRVVKSVINHHSRLSDVPLIHLFAPRGFCARLHPYATGEIDHQNAGGV